MVLLASLLVIPLLMVLALLLEWLERVFARAELAIEISRLLENEVEIDLLERRIASATQPLIERFSG